MVLFMFMWIVAAGIAFAWLLFVSPDVPRGRELAIVAAVALIVRFVPLLVYREPQGGWIVDINNYTKTANDILHGRDIYARDLFPHPYLPFQMYVLALSKAIANVTSIPFFTVLRVPQALADVGTALLVARTASRMRGVSEGARSGLLYAVCPFPVLVTIYHGQFDVISVFFAVAAVTALHETRGAASAHRSAALLALGILQKTWPAFLLPLMLAPLRDHRLRLEYIGLIGVMVGGSVLAYMLAIGSSPQRLYDSVVLYRTPFPSYGGPPLIIDHFLEFVPGSGALFRFEVDHGQWPAYVAALAVASWLVVRRVPLFPAATCLLAVLFAMLNDGSPYHYVWIVPFGLLAGQRLFVALIVFAYSPVYVIIAFIGGALIYPAVDGPGTQWLWDHAWWFSILGWATFTLWSIIIINRYRTPAPAVEGVHAVVIPSPS